MSGLIQRIYNILSRYVLTAERFCFIAVSHDENTLSGPLVASELTSHLTVTIWLGIRSTLALSRMFLKILFAHVIIVTILVNFIHTRHHRMCNLI